MSNENFQNLPSVAQWWDMRKMKGDGEIDKREKKWANTTLFLF